MCLRPFGLYCSACLGIFFVSILCMCCSHFSWYCFISFTIFSAPVFSLIHWFFFLYLVLLFQEGVSKISSVLLLNVVPLFSPFSVSLWLNLVSQFSVHFPPLHPWTRITNYHRSEGVILYTSIFISFKTKMDILQCYRQWLSSFGLAAAEIWKHHNALSLTWYFSLSKVISFLKLIHL